MSQTIRNEQTEVLQDVCSDSSKLEETKAICSRDTVVMDERGNLRPSDEVSEDRQRMLLRKQLVLGTCDEWNQHSLSEANDIIGSIPSHYDRRDEIVRFINKKLQ